MKSSRFKNILFDLDGTIADSKTGVLKSMLWAFEEMDLKLPNPSEIEVGPPIQETLRRLLGKDNENLYLETLTMYRKRYKEKGVFESTIFPGVRKMIIDISEIATLFVATSKATIFAKQLLEHLSLASYFRQIHGSSLDGKIIEKTDIVAEVIRANKLSPQTSVMIGDRKHDIIGGSANGLFTIGVCWGYGSAEELKSAGASAIASSPKELLELL